MTLSTVEIGLLPALVGAIPPTAALGIIAWLLKRVVTDMDRRNGEAHKAAAEAQTVATTAHQRVEVLLAGGPYARADLCPLQHGSVVDSLARIEQLMREDREERARMWQRIDNFAERMKAIEVRLSMGDGNAK